MPDDRRHPVRSLRDSRSLLCCRRIVTVAAISGLHRDRQRRQPSRTWHGRTRRFAPCGAVDPDAGVLYAYGGRGDDGATHHGDLWALDLGHGRRRPSGLAPRGRRRSPPTPRRRCAAAPPPGIATAGRLIVFGGWNGVTHDGACGPSTRSPARGTCCAPPRRAATGPVARRASQIAVDERAPPPARVRWHQRLVLRRPLVAVARHADVDPPGLRADRPRRSLHGDRRRTATRCGCSAGPVPAPTSATCGASTCHRHLDRGDAGVRRGVPVAPLGRDVDRRRRPGTGSCSTAAGSRPANVYRREAWTLDRPRRHADVDGGHAGQRVAAGPLLPRRRLRPGRPARWSCSAAGPTAARSRTPSG